ESEGEAFLARLLLGEPGVGDGAELGEDRPGRLDREAAPLGLDAALHLADPLARAPFERERREVDAGLLADLQRRQAEVEVVVEVLALDLVEDRPAGVEVAELAELPEQLLLLVLGADRVAHGDPAPPLDAVHDEGSPALAEEQRFVA